MPEDALRAKVVEIALEHSGLNGDLPPASCRRRQVRRVNKMVAGGSSVPVREGADAPLPVLGPGAPCGPGRLVLGRKSGDCGHGYGESGRGSQEVYHLSPLLFCGCGSCGL
jgi:hypothetical protein